MKNKFYLLIILAFSVFTIQAATWMNGKANCTINSYYLYNIDGKEACEVNLTYGGAPYQLAIDMSTTTGSLMYTMVVQAKRENRMVVAYWGDGVMTIWDRNRATAGGISAVQITVPIIGDLGIQY